MIIETEDTPNPATIKFLPGQVIMEHGTHDFAHADDAAASPLATALFTLNEVNGVFFGRDFISVTTVRPQNWPSLKGDILAIMLDHFTAQTPLFTKGALNNINNLSPTPIGDDDIDPEIIDQIHDLIETRIRPAVANDGGDIIYRGFSKGTVYLQMQGACAGCPSSTATLKHGIESLLKHYVPEVSAVEAV